MKSTYAAVETLVMLVHNDFQSVLELLVGFLELIVLIHQAQTAGIVQLQGDLDGNTRRRCHEGPLLLDVAEDLCGHGLSNHSAL
jgi:hypothetical protein